MSSSKPNRTVPVSAAIVAISLLFAGNFWIATQKNLSRESKLDPHLSDALVVTQFCRNETRQPDIALLGSSLVAVASVQAAAIAVNKPVDRLSHRESECFDQALQKNLGLTAKTVSLALGGAMASDAYLLTKHVLNGPQPPRAIIYGISVRDFQDNLMFGVETSEAFKLFYALDDLPDIWALPKVTAETKLALTFAAVSPIWENRAELSKQLLACKPVSNVFPSTPQSCGVAAVPMKIDGPLAPGEAVAHPTSEHMKEAYQIRYSPLAPHQFRTQMAYFNRLLDLCSKRHVPILVVNMPISEANVAIMPPKLYESYLAETQKICRQHSVDYQDLNRQPLNQSSNFLETVHLNPQGSAAFFDALAKTVSGTAVVRSLAAGPHYAAVDRAHSM